jgi:small-conductance mechanosensitive channel
MDHFLQQSYLGNSVASYLTAAGLLLASLLGLALARAFLLRRLERWSASTETTLDDFLVDALKHTVFPLLTAGAFALALHVLSLPAAFQKLIALLWTALLTFYGVLFVLRVVSYSLHDRWTAKRPGQAMAMKAVLPVLKSAVWVLGLIFFLDNAGVKISAVVAGLGIGGVAVALAAQAVLADLFCYFAILFDHPFAIGDFIIVDDLMGTVENIGIKTTRVRSLTGEILVFPNSSITSARVRNFQGLERRRVHFSLGVTYETPLEKLKEIPALIRKIVESAPHTVFDRAHFSSYGESALNFEIVYFVLTSDYNAHMDVQQAVNFAIKEEFDKCGVEFAYPTSVIYNINR